MPFKHTQKQGRKNYKQRYKLSNWSDYNNALKRRGDITIFLSPEVIEQWHESDQVNLGRGRPVMYSDLAITICHEMRQVFRLPLRQTQGFINSLFMLMGLSIRCPDYTTLSKRLSALGIKIPRYQRDYQRDANVRAIAIDGTGLKEYGYDEWHKQKHSLNRQSGWRQMMIAVNENHVIEAASLTPHRVAETTELPGLLDQITGGVNHFSADGAFDSAKVYRQLEAHSPGSVIAIPACANASIANEGSRARQQSILEKRRLGQLKWQKQREYGRRNNSEMAMQRYKKILGRALHARQLTSQKMEVMIGCGVLNKMTSLGMPESYRCA